MNFEYDFAMLGAKKISSKINYRSEQKCNSKIFFLSHCALHVLHRNWGKFKNDKRAKLYEDIMSAPLDIFSMSLRRMDLQRILVREHTMHLQLFYLIGTKTILSVQRFWPRTDSLNRKVFVSSGVWVFWLSKGGFFS